MNEPLLHESWNEVRFYTTIVYGSDRNPVAKRSGRDGRKEEDDEGTRRGRGEEKRVVPTKQNDKRERERKRDGRSKKKRKIRRERGDGRKRRGEEKEERERERNTKRFV